MSGVRIPVVSGALPTSLALSMTLSMTLSMALSMALSLVLTLALETGFFLLIGKRGKKDLLLVIMVNILTNPVVVLVYWLTILYTDWDTRAIVIPLELFAIVTEWYYYRKYGNGFKQPFLFSATANMFSFLTGVLLQYLV